MSSKSITRAILVCMVLGIIVGYFCNTFAADADTAKTISGYFGVVADIFLRLIKMIIAPLVFATLVSGIAHMGDTKAIGRIGLKAMLWFVGASFVSLLIGLIMVNILRPGDNLNLPLPDANAATNLKASSLNLKDFITHLVPRSAVEAMATNEILQIVVFSIFFGVACRRARRQGEARRARDRGVRPRHPQGDRLHHERRAGRGLRRHGRHRHDAGPRHPGHLRQVHALFLPEHRRALGLHGDRRIPAARQRCRAPVPADPRAVPAGLQHRQQRGRLPGHHGAAVQVSA